MNGLGWAGRDWGLTLVFFSLFVSWYFGGGLLGRVMASVDASVEKSWRHSKYCLHCTVQYGFWLVGVGDVYLTPRPRPPCKIVGTWALWVSVEGDETGLWILDEGVSSSSCRLCCIEP